MAKITLRARLIAGVLAEQIHNACVLDNNIRDAWLRAYPRNNHLPREVTMYANRFQQKVAKTYAGGDFAYVLKLDDKQFYQAIRDVGDTLFTFLMIELSDGEGCTDDVEAINRLRRTLDQVDEVLREIAPDYEY